MEHNWDLDTINTFGNDRCKNCGIQYEYYQRNLATLNSWTAKEIEEDKEHYELMLKSQKECIPRGKSENK